MTTDTNQPDDKADEDDEPRTNLALVVQSAFVVAMFYGIAQSEPLLGDALYDAVIYFFITCAIITVCFYGIRFVSDTVLRKKLGASEKTITTSIIAMILVGFVAAVYGLAMAPEFIQ